MSRATYLGSDQASELLSCLIGKDSESAVLSRLELRRRGLIASAAAFRVLMMLTTRDLEGIDTSPKSWPTAQGLLADVIKGGEGLRNAGAVSIGFHFVDPLCGRVSRMWVSDEWPVPANIKVEGADRAAFWYIFAHLWLRSYWQLLSSNTTLLNAYHEERIPWNRESLHLAWDDKIAESMAPSMDAAFLASCRDLASELTGVLGSTIARSWQAAQHVLARWRSETALWLTARRDPQYSRLVRALASEAVEALENAHFRERADDACESYRRLVLDDKAERDRFIKVLQTIHGTRGRACKLGKEIGVWSAEKKDRPSVWISDSWRDALACIQAVQSCVMNEKAFCCRSGLWIDVSHPREPGKEHLTTYLVIGLRCQLDMNTVQLESGRIRQTLETLVSVVDRRYARAEVVRDTTLTESAEAGVNRAFDILCREATRRAGRPGEKSVSARPPRSLPATGGAAPVPNWVGAPALLQFLRLLWQLSDQATHEGRELSFLLGMGPAYLADTQCRVFERAPLDLVRVPVDEARVTHYLKSYFSLFGNSATRLVWCDSEGHFRGVYEAVAPSGDLEWLANWGKRSSGYLMGRIMGQSRFEVLDEQLAILVLRNRESVRCPDEEKAVRATLRRLVSYVHQEPSLTDAQLDSLADIISGLLSTVRDLRFPISLLVVDGRDGRTIVRDEPTPPSLGHWRAPVAAQVGPMAAPLVSYAVPVARLDRIKACSGRYIEAVVGPLARVAELDGALMLTVRSAEGSDHLDLVCSPAQQCVPLVPRLRHLKAGYGSLENALKGSAYGSLDLYEWPEEFEHYLDHPHDDLRTIFGKPTPWMPPVRLDFPQALALVESVRTAETRARVTVWKGDTVKLDDPDPDVLDWVHDLAFLNSAGARHHSLWGISLTAEENLFTVTVSQDGDLRVFFDGRLVRIRGE